MISERVKEALRRHSVIQGMELPDWVEVLRPHQEQAVREVLDGFRSGSRVVVLDAPTGSGKTLIGEVVRRNLGVRGLYICSTKTLQDQCARDFPEARVIKGRGNYPTQKGGEITSWQSVSCEDCTVKSSLFCPFCESEDVCPYVVAKREAMAADLAILNTSYWLNVNRKWQAGLTILDECDLLEKALMDHVSVEVSARRMQQWKWEEPKRVTVEESWREWLDDKIPQVQEKLSVARRKQSGVKAQREVRYLANLAGKLKGVQKDLASEGDAGWVYTGRGGAASFKPAQVDRLGGEYIWEQGDRFLLMSGTVISSRELLDSLGFNGSWRNVVVPSTFLPEHRRIVVWPVADMSNKAKEWDKCVEGIRAVAARHPGESVLVHTVSYDLARHLASLDWYRPAISYVSSWERDTGLALFGEADERGAILFAPSMDRGIDLPGDICRVQVIAKVPFPYLGDRQVSKRLHSRGGQVWYSVQTVRTIVQMSGRAVRGKDDWAVTYILDKQFQRLFRQNRGLFPKWWSEAIEWRMNGLSPVS